MYFLALILKHTLNIALREPRMRPKKKYFNHGFLAAVYSHVFIQVFPIFHVEGATNETEWNMKL